ncbi:MAG: SMP-30/gluconolactonase/LRE family protein [Rhodospirillales bacterium]|nr:SMP-30/gluconolactonase/LRE family protein [Rhodospirillales bacterium]
MAPPTIEKALKIRSETGEGAVWSVAEQVLYWVDIPRGHLNRFDPSTGENMVYQMPTPIGCLALTDSDGVVVALTNGFHFFNFDDQSLTLINNPKEDEPGNRFNDGTTDPKGRFFAGTMPFQGGGGEPEGSLFVLDLDGSARRLEQGLWTQNGLAFSPDGKSIYLADTNLRDGVIWVYDYDPDDLSMTNKRVFFETSGVAGKPDGGTIDADGCYWTAAVRGWELIRLTSKGDIDLRIEMPIEMPTKIAFGGPNLDIMYVTSIAGSNPDPERPLEGCLFAVTAGIQGLPSIAYQGPLRKV